MRHNQEKDSQTISSKTHSTDMDDALAALEECRLALEKIVVPLGKPVELLPRSERVIKMQIALVMIRQNSYVLLYLYIF